MPAGSFKNGNYGFDITIKELSSSLGSLLSSKELSKPVQAEWTGVSPLLTHLA